MEQSTSKPVSPSRRAYIKDGIMYNEFVGEITLSAILDVEVQAIALIRKNNIKTIPVIDVLIDIDKTNLKLHLSDYSKAVASVDLLRHISHSWMVGAHGEVRKVAEVIGKIFLSNNLSIVDTLEEAESAARELINSEKTILDEQ